jgi:hypothetical protein
LITKHLRCIKYKFKNLKSREVSEVVSSVDRSVLRELLDDIGAAMSAADGAKVTADEVKEGLADAQDAASEPQADAIDSVQSLNAARISGLNAISSGTVKTTVGCMKYECEKKKLEVNMKSVDVPIPALSVDASVPHELRDEIADVKVAVENAMALQDEAQKATLWSRRTPVKTIFDTPTPDVTLPPAMRRFGVHGDAETP